jgi:hypothetical protein
MLIKNEILNLVIVVVVVMMVVIGTADVSPIVWGIRFNSLDLKTCISKPIISSKAGRLIHTDLLT